MIIDLIKKKYGDGFKLLEPILCEDISIPEKLRKILHQSNGIQETMAHPKTGEKMVIGWILYSHEEMVKATNYYKDEYGLHGTVFSDDGAGNPYYLFEDKIYEFDPIDNESTLLANSIEEFYRR